MTSKPLENIEGLREKAQQVYKILLKKYGRPTWRQPPSPLDELISTILSQNTNDANRDLAFSRLKKRFPYWEQVRDAPVEAIIDAIRPAGLGNQKGAHIKKVLQQISSERGNLELDFLKRLSKQEAQIWLMRFKGVGAKTAAIVLQFALGIPAFPVDTHIYRVSGRLDLRPEKMSAEKAHAHLEELFLPSQYEAAHLNIIRLGREICLARKPHCAVCPLRSLCDYYRLTVYKENNSGKSN